MYGFLSRGWEIILPGCGGTSALAREATLAACWLHEPQAISSQPVGLGFPHPVRRYRPGGSAFLSPGCWSSRAMEGFLTRGWYYPPRLRRDLGVGPRGNSRRALAPGAPTNQQSPSGVRVSTPCGAVSTPGICVVVPALLELSMYGRISDSGIGTYPSRRALALYDPQPSSNRPVGLGFPHCAGWF